SPSPILPWPVPRPPSPSPLPSVPHLAPCGSATCRQSALTPFTARSDTPFPFSPRPFPLPPSAVHIPPSPPLTLRQADREHASATCRQSALTPFTTRSDARPPSTADVANAAADSAACNLAATSARAAKDIPAASCRRSCN
ncbi:unnamed protein product, partial [Closterium sp. NIES-53]